MSSKGPTWRGYLRQFGENFTGSKRAPGQIPTPAVLLAVVKVTFDPTAAAGTVTDVTLPKGARPAFAQIVSAGATGGTNPTVDIGLQGGNNDALVNEGDADTQSPALLTTGTALQTALASRTRITAGQGASAATGGTVTAAIYYYADDDGKIAD